MSEESKKTVADEMSLRERQLYTLRNAIRALHIELSVARVSTPHPVTYRETDIAVEEFLKATEGVFHL